jgi:predicted HicB family RNase H-like nuclease
MGQETRDTGSARTIIVRLTPETHKALRIKVAEEDTSIQQWVESLIERELGGGKRTPDSAKSGKK